MKVVLGTDEPLSVGSDEPLSVGSDGQVARRTPLQLKAI